MIGQRIGVYRIEKRLGAGAMGEVYSAVHESIGNRVAIKFLSSACARRPAAVARLWREAQAANRVRHPGIVRVEHIGQTADMIPYLILEYLEGIVLSDRLSGGQRCLYAEALNIARQTAHALAAAHQRGVVHRDIKPENIMLVVDTDGTVQVKLLDFGIALVVDLERLTGTHDVLGTPAYMSPESWQSASRAQPAVDVYALGVMLFRMISGTLPFDGKGIGELLHQQMVQVPPALSQLVPGVVPELSDLVAMMLAKNPAARPTMLKVAATLRRLSQVSSSTTLAPQQKTSLARRCVVWALPTVLLGSTALWGVHARESAAPAASSGPQGSSALNAPPVSSAVALLPKLEAETLPRTKLPKVERSKGASLKGKSPHLPPPPIRAAVATLPRSDEGGDAADGGEGESRLATALRVAKADALRNPFPDLDSAAGNVQVSSATAKADRLLQDAQLYREQRNFTKALALARQAQHMLPRTSLLYIGKLGCELRNPGLVQSVYRQLDMDRRSGLSDICRQYAMRRLGSRFIPSHVPAVTHFDKENDQNQYMAAERAFYAQAYQQAIELAGELTQRPRFQDAWQLIGRAACHLRDAQRAVPALYRLDPGRQRNVIEVCRRNRVFLKRE